MNYECLWILQAVHHGSAWHHCLTMADLLAATFTVSSHFWNTVDVRSPNTDWDLINDLSQKAATEYQDVIRQEVAVLMPASCSFSLHFLPLCIFCANAFSLKTFLYFSIYILITVFKKKAFHIASQSNLLDVFKFHIKIHTGPCSSSLSSAVRY